MLTVEAQKEITVRLKKITGQIGGIEKMVDQPRLCVDILNQIGAVRAALEGVGFLVLENHLKVCLPEATTAKQRKEAIDELVTVLKRLL